MSEAVAEDEAGAAAAAAPRRGDKPPKAKAKGRGGRRPGAGRPKGAANKPKEAKAPPAGAALAAQDRALVAGLATVLTLPAVPAVMFTPTDEGKSFMGAHFAATGPATAMQLVELSHQSPELRDILMKMTEGGLWTGLATLAVCYVGPPILWSIGKRGAAQAVEAFATMDPAEMAQAMAAAQSTMPDDADPASAEAQQRQAADAARAAARPPEPGADPAQQ